MSAYGLVGVGAIAEAIVVGLSESDDPPALTLSPRSADISAALAERYANVGIAADNQAVLDAAPVVLLCVRPQIARAVVSDLRFRDDHVVISVMAGISIDELERLIAPATDVCRCIPLPAVARHSGVTPIHPPQPIARALFDRLGSAVEVPDIEAYDGFAVASATMAAHFEFLRTVSGWLTRQGVAADDASRYLAAVFAALGDAVETSHDFAHLAREHATVGGINEHFQRTLTEAGVYDEVSTALDAVLTRLRTL
ncbi:pyrroline-5-carboxylate reductase [Solirubrobacter soli]|uniref:pyrroline-5-carboxylate reductase n=1 Tax=Solirubrobacter soli TaxID=363832 RepID=UPI0004023630|nr:pyrroline-5-carboxylate reductase [Solirubrobacter soli]